MPLIEIRDVVKAYGGLRPFRLQELTVSPGEVVIVDGPDQPAAGVLTDLVTGTVLPDTGSVQVDGRPTSSLATHDDWLAFLERFGIVNDRVVLLDGLTVAANLAVPLTLDLDPLPPSIARAVAALGAEIGLDTSSLDARLGDCRPLDRWLVQLGRALAHRPSVLLVEHPALALAAEADTMAAAAAVNRITGSRRIATLVASADKPFNRRAATRQLEWEAATGRLREPAGWSRWFRHTSKPV
jgi:ABC-type transporter Mla maintaining outer membrane lipid asymmetry ATPase subunit MlaF